ncbi:MAG: hypothetical protein Q9177_005016 [Variospora cf. flavescens]
MFAALKVLAGDQDQVLTRSGSFAVSLDRVFPTVKAKRKISGIVQYCKELMQH